MVKWSRGPNRWLGADGLAVTAQGLKISYSDLFNASVAYTTAAHEGVACQRDRTTALPEVWDHLEVAVSSSGLAFGGRVIAFSGSRW